MYGVAIEYLGDADRLVRTPASTGSMRRRRRRSGRDDGLADEMGTGDADYATTTEGGRRTDHVDHLIEQWHRERPDLDVSPMEVIARISRLCRILERRIEELYAQLRAQPGSVRRARAFRRAGRRTASRRPISTSRSPDHLGRDHAPARPARDRGLCRAASRTRTTAAEHARRSLTPAGKRLIDRMLDHHYENEDRLLARAPRSTSASSSRTLLRRLLLDRGPPSAAGPADPGVTS